MKRRNFVTGSLAATGLVGLPHLFPAFSAGTTRSLQDNDKPVSSVRVKSVDEMVTAETREAITAGLQYLNRRQNKSSGQLRGAFGTSGYASGVAITSLAGLAFLCSGSTPNVGAYARHVRRCTDFILRHTRDTGYIASDSTSYSNMYGHGYGMLYLSQIVGMSPSSEVEEKLQRALDMTCEVQNDQGGWRYQPRKQTGDLSITICQIMALRAAHDAGLRVSEAAREKTIEYVKRSHKSDGSFQYTLRGGRVSVALTAAGVVSLYSAGIYEGEMVESALKWLIKRKPGAASGDTVSPMNYYYAHYYAVQAMWHAQLRNPEYWNEWYPAIRDELLGKQKSGSYWNDQKAGSEFATAMCCIILQIPFNYLPVFAP